MQQLLGLEELPVVERCELAARLLLSLRGDLVPCTQQPGMGYDKRAWWQVQVWQVPVGAQGSKERPTLQGQLGTFLKDFFKLAGQVRLGVWHVPVKTMLVMQPCCMRCMCKPKGALAGPGSTARNGEAKPVLSSMLTLYHDNSSGLSHSKDILLCLR